ncbi:PAAR domain-containing protein [Pseudomonas putida]|uniref:PAAR domain-containing protein n=1 Tax=Pseudomonas putida TaxID=303 RepID=UPI001575F9B2|nr:PAAR domain-containing protein [Pseudomonas putida]NTY90576.1 PAAR domain-containing protein [Pseudomonas putida]NTZ02817.1 PAAR domain-containing protein [Pseudomonas putida]NTZ21903.1 PAAR domain-containing protein [Pseudomonas putida]NTZ58384.1 PAAR domain-containing protein [Pseudomonas putida]NTZ69292.1 PAAR domain-containing protein [Pseudomonas putida]
MSMRMNIFGRYQGLEGDQTTTGAICIASRARGRVHGRNWLLQGDPTTPCPLCGQAGTIIEGESRWRQDDIPTALDGALVQCGCPSGSNRLVASGHAPAASRRAPAPEPVHEAPPQAQASNQVSSSYQPRAHQPSKTAQGMEPGFYIVPRCVTYQEVLAELGAPQANLPSSILERLNPTYQRGFKAGEIFVIGDGLRRPVCTREELTAMSAAKQAREALASLTPEEAEFMMRHQAEIAGLLSDVSLAMGVSEAMVGRSLDELSEILRKIEDLHKDQFIKHGHLRHPEFFAKRQKLFTQLSKNLNATVLNKRLNLGNYESLRRDLGISSKSLVHHWSKAGGPTHIPGYATHLDKLAKMTKYLKTGGRIGITIGGIGSAIKISEVCKEGNSTACEKVKVTETSNFSGGLAGGWAAGKVSARVSAKVCWRFGPGTVACGIVITGTGTLAGSVGGMKYGEKLGELVFEVFSDD